MVTVLNLHIATPCAFIFGGMGFLEVLVIGMIAVLLYGKRLPEVARDVGKYYAQFRSALQDIQHEFTKATSDVTSTVQEAQQQLLSYDDDEEPTAPQFTAPPSDDA